MIIFLSVSLILISALLVWVTHLLRLEGKKLNPERERLGRLIVEGESLIKSFGDEVAENRRLRDDLKSAHSVIEMLMSERNNRQPQIMKDEILRIFSY